MDTGDKSCNLYELWKLIADLLTFPLEQVVLMFQQTSIHATSVSNRETTETNIEHNILWVYVASKSIIPGTILKPKTHSNGFVN